jgi:hypothetical protein
MNPFIYDLRYLKYRFIQAYFHFQLLEAQRLTDNGQGIECVTDASIIGDAINKIMIIIDKNNNTYEEIVKVIKFNPYMREYYNVIGDTVKKHFKINQGWIPSFLAIEVLRHFDDKGYKDFKDIDFVALQAYYEKHEDRKNHQLPLHYKCAEDIYNSIMKKRIFKKKRKK